jgi:hypothetical protein
MPIFLSSFMLPGSGSVPFILEDTQLRGGFRVVNTTTDRDDIVLGSRKEGILVYVIADSTYYKLGPDLTTWAEFTVQPSTHNHDTAYSPLTHNHDSEYSTLTHNHDSDYSDISHTHTKSDIGLGNVDNTSDADKPVSSAAQIELNLKVDNTLVGANNGIAQLDAQGRVPSSQLPSYVDDVIEHANLAAFPVTGEGSKIYIAIDTNITYRWSGSSYVPTGSDLALGETSSTAYRGDRGKIAYDHSQTNHYSTANELLIAIKTVDGAGSGLDADLLDGLSSDAFLRIDGGATVTLNKNLNVIGTISQNGSPLPTGSGGGSTGLFSKGLF